MAIPLGPNVAATAPARIGELYPDDQPGLRLPYGVEGWARPELAPVVRTFEWMFTKYRLGGGGLSVYVDGEPALDIWAGAAAAGQGWTRDTGALVFSASKGIAATVIHRLVDRGLLAYDAPVARYWPEFGANGKSSITVRQVLDHRAGLSRLDGIVCHAEEIVDHELMEQRLAAAPVDKFYGKRAYHALTFGWLLAGMARAVTGQDMRELFRTEIAEPLGVEGIHLGRPPRTSPTKAASMYPFLESVVSKPLVGRVLPTVIRAIDRLPGFEGAIGTMYEPGMERILADDGTLNSALYDMQAPAANAVATASSLAKMYAALAGGGTVDGREFLSEETVAGLSRKPNLAIDHTIVFPMGMHLGYMSLPMRGFRSGFGHIGLGGSMGWADPKRRISVGFTHNRLPMTMALDQISFAFLWPQIVKAVG
ncbi:beta-lactamase family protein [Mycobacterium sp. CBMA271]|uniref:serine hydrolase domain-containing protein n=1 Tax=unclassified Mycobacteroides TaxID=2618759 RepID=UPI0012DFC03C|nr:MULTISPECIES: serine hydrolase domain-containing protein [unclassified Mycobacteroides]MUM16566.1 esterase [Mycobacteroides sp. CBMA 326]MUM22127.1 beta-lactamase family protein [Mycobacteroides sp. CBMA 271]